MNDSIRGILDPATEATVACDTYRRIEALLREEVRSIVNRAEADEEATRRATIAVLILDEFANRYAKVADAWAEYARLRIEG